MAEQRVSREEMLRRYLGHLEASQGELPMRGGLPNKRAIAAACGFSREAFYDNPRVASLLAEHMGHVSEGMPLNTSKMWWFLYVDVHPYRNITCLLRTSR